MKILYSDHHDALLLVEKIPLACFTADHFLWSWQIPCSPFILTHTWILTWTECSSCSSSLLIHNSKCVVLFSAMAQSVASCSFPCPLFPDVFSSSFCSKEGKRGRFKMLFSMARKEEKERGRRCSQLGLWWRWWATVASEESGFHAEGDEDDGPRNTKAIPESVATGSSGEERGTSSTTTPFSFPLCFCAIIFIRRRRRHHAPTCTCVTV